jgi:hypothetical protein
VKAIMLELVTMLAEELECDAFLDLLLKPE